MSSLLLTALFGSTPAMLMADSMDSTEGLQSIRDDLKPESLLLASYESFGGLRVSKQITPWKQSSNPILLRTLTT